MEKDRGIGNMIDSLITYENVHDCKTMGLKDVYGIVKIFYDGAYVGYYCGYQPKGFYTCDHDKVCSSSNINDGSKQVISQFLYGSGVHVDNVFPSKHWILRVSNVKVVLENGLPTKAIGRVQFNTMACHGTSEASKPVGSEVMTIDLVTKTFENKKNIVFENRSEMVAAIIAAI